MNLSSLTLSARDAFVRTNRRAVAIMFVRLSVSNGRALRLHGALWRGFKFMVGQSNVLDTLTPKHAHLLPDVFFQFHLEERWGMDVQTRCNISRTVEDKGYVTIEC